MTPRELRCIIRDNMTRHYTPTPPSAMPTARRRIQVMLDEEQYEAVRDLAQATRLSMSRVVADVIEPAVPLLIRARKMILDASVLTTEAHQLLKHDLAVNERKAEKAAGHAYQALAETEAAIRRAGVGAKRARQPAGRRTRPPSE